jgi:D-glucosaminate-6-phosphate ammonia-lyase
MFDRRAFIKSLSSVPVLGTFFGGSAAMAATKRDYFREIGVKPFINGAGTYTTLTASLMRPEVMEAINFASKSFVRLNELQDAASLRIASLTGAESAMVTSGAAGALVVGTAACLTGTNADFIQRLPDTTGMRNEVLIQKVHRYGYDHAVRACGIKMVEVDTAEDMERAANPHTAMMLFFNANEPLGQIKAPEFIAFGKKHGIPTFNDAAADTPPVENITKYVKMGWDLITFSGGKGIRGPQSAGLLLGRKDLIQAARMNTSPNSDTIGRGLKVNKEEILGMMVALEVFMKSDQQAAWREYEKRVKTIADSVQPIKGVKTETWMGEIANHVPHLKITWDPSDIKMSVADVQKKLREGDPSIEVVPGTDNGLVIGVWMLQPGESEIVAKRVREVLRSA